MKISEKIHNAHFNEPKSGPYWALLFILFFVGFLLLGASKIIF